MSSVTVSDKALQTRRKRRRAVPSSSASEPEDVQPHPSIEVAHPSQQCGFATETGRLTCKAIFLPQQDVDTTATRAASATNMYDDPLDNDGTSSGHLLSSRGRGTTGPRQEQLRVINAARQYLRSHRGDDEAMEMRHRALSRLSRGEAQRFVETNKDRRPGEWVWSVLDERIRALSEETKCVANWAAAHCPSPDKVVPEIPPTASSSLREVSGNCDNLDALGVLRTSAPRSKIQSIAVEQIVENKKLGTTAKLSQRTGLQQRGKRPMYPRLPVFKDGESSSATKWVPASLRKDVSAKLSTPVGDGTQACLHLVRNRPSMAGCCWICADCGEELQYDGWRMEFSMGGPIPRKPVAEGTDPQATTQSNHIH